MKFSIGDRVVYKETNEKATVIAVDLRDRKYVIRFDNPHSRHRWPVIRGGEANLNYNLIEDTRYIYWYAREDEIILIGRPRVRRVVIEITDNGANVKYISGKRVENAISIHRYKDDASDDAKAAQIAVAKLFGVDIKGEEEKNEKAFSEMRDAWRKFKSVIEDKIFDNYGEE